MGAHLSPTMETLLDAYSGGIILIHRYLSHHINLPLLLSFVKTDNRLMEPVHQYLYANLARLQLFLKRFACVLGQPRAC